MTRARKRLFHWRGVTADGMPCSGWTAAHDSDELSRRLAAGGVTLVRARAQRRTVRIKTPEAYRFLEQLASLLGAGVPILDALELIREERVPHRLEAVFRGIFESIESGLPLSESLAPFLGRGDRIIPRVLTLGERSGKLDEVLARLLKRRKAAVHAREQLTRAAVYPAVLITVSTAIILLMMIWAVPEFSRIYADFGAALPTWTLTVIAASDFVINNGLATAAWIACASCAFVAAQRTSPTFQRTTAHVQLRLPLIGHLVRVRLYRRFAADMNLIYRSGMPLGAALDWLPAAAGHPLYRTALECVRESVSRGLSLHRALEDTRFFPPFVVQTVRVGENSGSLESAFERIERFYDEALENAADRLVKSFEPLLIATLSLIIGALVVAMYLPMFNLGFVL